MRKYNQECLSSKLELILTYCVIPFSRTGLPAETHGNIKGYIFGLKCPSGRVFTKYNLVWHRRCIIFGYILEIIKFSIVFFSCGLCCTIAVIMSLTWLMWQKGNGLICPELLVIGQECHIYTSWKCSELTGEPKTMGSSEFVEFF